MCTEFKRFNSRSFEPQNQVPHQRYLYFEVAVGLAWSNDPESYAGGSVPTVRASHAGHVEGDDPD
jgi:hypothetical protein